MDAEAQLLGGVVVRGWEAFDEVRDLDVRHFGLPRHQAIWRAVKALAAAAPGESWSVVEIFERLRMHGEADLVGGMPELARLEPIGYHGAHRQRESAKIVRRYAAARDAHELARSMVHDIESDPDLIDPTQWVPYCRRRAAALDGLGSIGTATDYLRTSKDVCAELRTQQLESAEGRGTRVSVGFPRLDVMLNCRTQNLLLLAGRPSHGKSAFLNAIVRELSFARLAGDWAWDLRAGAAPIAIVPAEMPAAGMMARLHADLASVDSRLVPSPSQADIAGEVGKRLRYARELTAASRITWVDDAVATDWDRARAALRHWRARNPEPGAVVGIDYLQYLRAAPQPGQRHWEDEQAMHDWICGDAKSLSKELDSLVILLVAANRNIERRDHKMHTSDDLRNVGKAEFHADQILFLQHQARWGREGLPKLWPKGVDGYEDARAIVEACQQQRDRGEPLTDEQRRVETQLRALMRIAYAVATKARNGEIGKVELVFESKFTRYREPYHEESR